MISYMMRMSLSHNPQTHRLLSLLLSHSFLSSPHSPLFIISWTFILYSQMANPHSHSLCSLSSLSSSFLPASTFPRSLSFHRRGPGGAIHSSPQTDHLKPPLTTISSKRREERKGEGRERDIGEEEMERERERQREIERQV